MCKLQAVTGVGGCTQNCMWVWGPMLCCSSSNPAPPPIHTPAISTGPLGTQHKTFKPPLPGLPFNEHICVSLTMCWGPAPHGPPQGEGGTWRCRVS